MLLRIIITAVILLVPNKSVVAADEVSDILSGLKQRYGSLPGMSVPYTREIISRTISMLPGKMRGDVASGTLHFKPPYSLRLDQDKPDHETLVSDGDKIWWHVPSKNMVNIYPFGKFGREFLLLSDVLRGLSRVGERFLTSLVPSEDSSEARALELRPEPQWEDVDRIVLTIAKDFRIMAVNIYNKIGGITRFELGEIKVKDDFPVDFFTFQIPSGAKVTQEGNQ